MKKIIRVQQRPTAPMNLTWIINNICPNKCTYCPPGLHNGQNHNYDWDNARRFFKELFLRYPKIHCSVAGGKPSVSPFLREIVEIFKKNNSTIGITSNAAKPVAYWEDISRYLNYISFSWHGQFIDDKFYEKVMAAVENTAVTVRIMIHPQDFERGVAEYEKFKDNPMIYTEPVRILNWNSSAVDPSNYTYTDEQIRWFETTVPKKKYLTHLSHLEFPDMSAKIIFDDDTFDDNPNVVSLINAGQTNFNGYMCEVGLKGLFIDWRGKIYMGNCQINGALGNINDPENIKWPTQAIMCNKNICHCASDVVLNKWLP